MRERPEANGLELGQPIVASIKMEKGVCEKEVGKKKLSDKQTGGKEILIIIPYVADFFFLFLS
jgi:hypothetical protein